jgi:hypothetical protein
VVVPFPSPALQLLLSADGTQGDVK